MVVCEVALPEKEPEKFDIVCPPYCYWVLQKTLAVVERERLCVRCAYGKFHPTM
jgi:hypothetical protein